MIATRSRHAASPSTWVSATTVLALVAAAIAASAFGADEARLSVDGRDIANAALLQSIDQGSGDPGVREALVGLRHKLSQRPLDSKTRVAYASLVLGLSRRLDDVPVAAYHAQRAAQLAPVTRPVVRSAALVLAHANEPEQAARLAATMFEYDGRRAAATLAQVEPMLRTGSVGDFLPSAPAAWLEWHFQLVQTGRTHEAIRWLEETHKRWPDFMPALSELARYAFRTRDWDALEALIPLNGTLPDDRTAVYPLLYRAMLRAVRGDPGGARADAVRAMHLTSATPGTNVLCGDVYQEINDHEIARDHWNRALFAFDPSQPERRIPVLRRLARLEGRNGRPGSALRYWRELLEIDPADREALRRVEAISHPAQ